MAAMKQDSVIGYREGQGDSFACYCLDCAQNEPTIAKECEPVLASDLGDFDGESPGCHHCGERIFDACEQDERDERRREYHDDIRADCRRLGLL